jgi:mRNA interferase MazF
LAKAPRRRDNFAKGYTPRFGDVVHLNWDPVVGHEMAGPHYGLVISATDFNVGTGLVVLIPITSKAGKLSNFELDISVGSVRGVAIISGLRSVDYTTRDIQFEVSGADAVAKTANVRIALLMPIA